MASDYIEFMANLFDEIRQSVEAMITAVQGGHLTLDSAPAMPEIGTRVALADHPFHNDTRLLLMAGIPCGFVRISQGRHTAQMIIRFLSRQMHSRVRLMMTEDDRQAFVKEVDRMLAELCLIVSQDEPRAVQWRSDKQIQPLVLRRIESHDPGSCEVYDAMD